MLEAFLLCCAGGYWALPLQWLTTSIVNNEFLDGERFYMLSSALQNKSFCCCTGMLDLRQNRGLRDDRGLEYEEMI